MAKYKYCGIDLFADTGGLSYGLSQAGFDMKIKIEIDTTFSTTLSNNHKNMNVINDDIQHINCLKVLEDYKIQKDEVTLIAGGPRARICI